jgi:glycosyltransferase involved in cell wall biosynthesis
MACYNAMPYLPAATDCILRQTFPDWELIVVDDGSTDDGSKYLEQLATHDRRVRVFRQENLGQQSAANLGIRQSHGEFIARMDADDLTPEFRLEKQVAFLDDHPEVGIVGGQIKRMGNTRSGMPSNLPLTHEEIFPGLLKNHHTFCNGTVMFRKALFEQIGGYWEHNIAEDWDMFLRMAEISKLANLPDVLLTYRLHTSSVNGRRIVEAQLYNEYAACLSRCRAAGKEEMPFEEFLASHRSRKWPGSWEFYLDSLSIGQYREAIAEIYNGQRIKGYARIGLAMAMAPARTFRRVLNIVDARTKPSRAN